MNQSPILSIREATIYFAKNTLFEDLGFNIFAHDRICLIGKNGVGKTTLMKIITGEADLDSGERWLAPGITIGYLSQSEYLPENVQVTDFIMSGAKLDDHKEYLIDIVCENLQIDKNALTHNLSGGQKRRVNLAKALVLEPEILLLDEPTNHLDLEVIQWLEDYLQSYRGALLVISHDRQFLEKVSNKVFWLRAGQIKVNNQGYKNFDSWSDGIIQQEIRELDNLEKKVEMESQWLQTGVTARRKRNIGRLHHLKDLKSKLSATRRLVKSNQSKINIKSQKLEDDSPQVILSFNNVNKGFNNKKLIDQFTLKILRGEKIGIIGKNGSGKSTLLKMMIKEIDPDSGTVKPARDISLSYFDQTREKMKANLTIQDFLCENGGDYINLANGKTIHVCGYLKNFMFDPSERDTRVATLSGGQKNRLLLAKTLANPGNFLILDEPTNDLDMESLDMLQEYLSKYPGTLVIVSHDRDFLDNTVTSILAFENEGKITHHLGGYSDYVEYLGKNNETKPQITANKIENKEVKIEKEILKKTFSYKHKVELKKLPDKIERLENQISKLSEELNNTEDRNPSNLAQISIEIAKYQSDLEKAESRWIELEELKENS